MKEAVEKFEQKYLWHPLLRISYSTGHDLFTQKMSCMTKRGDRTWSFDTTLMQPSELYKTSRVCLYSRGLG